MQHVDEGTIHAWLDRQITDAAEAARIDAHLKMCAACRARMEEERATLGQAEALLASSAPAAQPPAFATLLERAGNIAPASSAAPAHATASTIRWMQPVAWAASLVLAVGIGWLARDYTGDAPTASTTLDTQVAERAESVVAPASAAAPESTAPSPVVESPDTGPSAAPSPRTAPASAEPARLLSGNAAADIVAPPAAPAPRKPDPGVAPQPDALRQAVETATAAATREAQASAPLSAPMPAAPQPFPAVSSAPARFEVTPSAPVTSPGASGGLTFPSTARTVNAGAPAMAFATPRTAWQVLPRTEAAARTQMPLYGISGGTPLFTTIGPDGTTVRTTYVIDGVNVELEQRRITAGDTAAADLQAARPAGRGVMADTTLMPRTWSVTRGDLQLTIRALSATIDLDALGARLRID